MNEAMERAKEYVKKGGKLTSEACPICGFILVEIEGTKKCSSCDRDVIITQDKDEYDKISSEMVLSELRNVMLEKIKNVSDEMKVQGDTSTYLELLSRYLDIMEKINRLRIDDE